MAERLVQGMVTSFQPEKYDDEYRRDLLSLIQRKVKAGELNRIPDATSKKKAKAPSTPGNVDLSELLARSLSGAKKAPRAANENHRPGKKPLRKKPHAVTHHRKSA